MANGKSIVLGVLFGSIVGASVSLLTTPQSGEDFRGKVKDQSSRLKELVQQLQVEGSRLKDQITRTSREGAALMKDLSQDIRTSVESWKETIEPHQENLQEHLQQIEESIKELEEKMNEQTKQKA